MTKLLPSRSTRMIQPTQINMFLTRTPKTQEIIARINDVGALLRAVITVNE